MPPDGRSVLSLKVTRLCDPARDGPPARIMPGRSPPSRSRSVRGKMWSAPRPLSIAETCRRRSAGSRSRSAKSCSTSHPQRPLPGFSGSRGRPMGASTYTRVRGSVRSSLPSPATRHHEVEVMATSLAPASSLLDHRAAGEPRRAPGRPASPSARDRPQASRTRRGTPRSSSGFCSAPGSARAAWSASSAVSGATSSPDPPAASTNADVRIRKTNVESE